MDRIMALACLAIKQEGKRAGRAARRGGVGLARLARNVADQARLWGSIDRETFEKLYTEGYKEGYGLPLPG